MFTHTGGIHEVNHSLSLNKLHVQPGQAPGMDAAVSLAHTDTVQCGQYKRRGKTREAADSCPCCQEAGLQHLAI